MSHRKRRFLFPLLSLSLSCLLARSFAFSLENEPYARTYTRTTLTSPPVNYESFNDSWTKDGGLPLHESMELSARRVNDRRISGLTLKLSWQIVVLFVRARARARIRAVRFPCDAGPGVQLHRFTYHDFHAATANIVTRYRSHGNPQRQPSVFNSTSERIKFFFHIIVDAYNTRGVLNEALGKRNGRRNAGRNLHRDASLRRCINEFPHIN